ncbi:hypothetical protein NEOLEDRAFT_1127765 [Neolentinus lepideus HHB14362 ss-1]|uniref:CS domain-containing protein n=1 Tax=Neolentinus lepideus HHB14362 ss-1 TaxID=1314782 RepID=A0A165VM41_9AGAM|nr:hypothetical protein NEOLEDRAFT_1127765 [Neolentinus lepideus HHB14362 ss-1]
MELQYSWHQSHDQATVLLVVPYDSTEDDILFVVDRNYIAAGVHDRAPMVKGRLYGQIDASTSTWQLEPRPLGYIGRERTVSSTSAASTQSSYSMLSEREVSSNFSGATGSGPSSDIEDFSGLSSATSSPVLSSPDEQNPFPVSQERRIHLSISRPRSPLLHPVSSVTSSISSLDSSSRSGRLLTLHLEKVESAIWPCLISGPAPGTIGCRSGCTLSLNQAAEQRYNMDPTSLMLLGCDLLDLRKEEEEAFEYFLRAWTLGRIPSAALRLVAHYLPPHVTPASSVVQQEPEPGTAGYYFKCIGGAEGLADAYLAAGYLHLEGTASRLLSLPYSPLSSIRFPSEGGQSAYSVSDTGVWQRDRETAKAYFRCARALNPTLDVPVLFTEEHDLRSGARSKDDIELSMPSTNIDSKETTGIAVQPDEPGNQTTGLHRRRRRSTITATSGVRLAEGQDSTWYLYLPGLVGAGTALLVVGVIGAINFSWKKNQSS